MYCHPMLDMDEGKPMNRRFAACTIAVFSMIGLSACGGGSDTSDATTTPAAVAKTTSAPAPVETTEAPAADTPAATEPDSDIAAACLQMAGPISDANAEMINLYQQPIDAQAAVDAWTSLTDAFGEISETVTNADVKSAAEAVHTDTTDLRDAMQKVYVEQDLSAMNDYTAATERFSTSYTALINLCAPGAAPAVN